MRLFIAIPISKELEEEIKAYQQLFKNLPLRLTPPENLHVTLVFLGETPQSEIFRIEEKIQSTLSTLNPEPLTLIPEKFEPGPQPSSPRLVWLAFKASQGIYDLQKNLARILQREEARPFRAHITVARLLRNAYLDPTRVARTPITNDLSLEVKQINLMASTLQRGGAEYSIIKTFPL